MGVASPATLELAKRLRWLRVEKWPDVRLTQSGLAEALGAENALSPVTVSSWESLTSPKLPPRPRLHAYARFFSTKRSIEAVPRLLPLEDLTDDERAEFTLLEAELLELLAAALNLTESNRTAARSWHFTDDGPVTLICAQRPDDKTALSMDPADPNYTELTSYSDLDALIELHGHLRAENPDMVVHFTTSRHVTADDLIGHIILLGGVEWDDVTSRLNEMTGIPIRQTSDPSVGSGKLFVTEYDDNKNQFLPKWKDEEAGTELVEDVGLLARAPNPFNTNRTLTICQGVHSRGSLGAVRSLTDARIRDSNERYISDNFSSNDLFAIIMRVPVIFGKAMPPDLTAPGGVLYSWPSELASGKNPKECRLVSRPGGWRKKQ
jgi:hypothetical protein